MRTFKEDRETFSRKRKLHVDDASPLPVVHESERLESLFFEVSWKAGRLLELFQWKTQEESWTLLDAHLAKKQKGGTLALQIMEILCCFSEILDIDLGKTLSNKIDKNSKKYPVSQVYGKNEKYDEYIKQRQALDNEGSDGAFVDMGGRTKAEPENGIGKEKENVNLCEVSLKGLVSQLEHFATERDWQQFHSPKNLLMALSGELGELGELFFRRKEELKSSRGGTVDCSYFASSSILTEFSEELADVLSYLLRFMDQASLLEAALDTRAS